MPLTPKTNQHFRSNSSPVDLHPVLCQFNEHFLRLQSYEGASTSHTVVSHKLTCLVALHDCVGTLLRLPSIQQDVTREQNERSVEALLDGCLWLIDVCDIIRGVLMRTKEGVQQLQSVLRRRPNKHEIVQEASLYFDSRKIVKKLNTKFLEHSKSFRKRFDVISSDRNKETFSFLWILRESQGISINVFDSLFSNMDGPRTLSKIGKWSLVSKLVHYRQMHKTEDYSQHNKFEFVDAALHMLIGQKAAKSPNNLQISKLGFHLEELESILLDLEKSMECLSTHFIKSRVTLLNILDR